MPVLLILIQIDANSPDFLKNRNKIPCMQGFELEHLNDIVLRNQEYGRWGRCVETGH